MTGNKSRINNSDPYGDRKMNKEQEILGEDIGKMGEGKGAHRKRLANEIEDNAYIEDVQLEVIDDPRFWGEDLQIRFIESRQEVSKANLKKYLRIIRKAYKWLREDKMGKTVTSIVSLRSVIGMTKPIWDKAEEESDEFTHYSLLIKDLVGGRIHDLGVHESKGQIFKIFSIKNLLPDEFADKREFTTNKNISLIQVVGGSKKIKEATEKGKKRLNK